jgi:Fe2+ or Zn2+ uptake regulation protein
MNHSSNERYHQKLIEKGIQSSFQRIQVLKYLYECEGHANAEEIYQALHGEIPTLSRTTIYNTLKLFLENGLVRVISIDGVEKRYDAILADHGHFKCENCGKIFNFPVEMNRIPLQGLDGFQVTEKNVFFNGLCPDCIQTKDQKGIQNGR